MVDFAEIVPVGPIVQKSGIEWKGKNFEEIYSLISEKPEYRDLQTEIEKAVFDYFSELRLPETPTLYDILVLSLRQKDVIATFNWDPFLIQACQRSAARTRLRARWRSNRRGEGENRSTPSPFAGRWS